MEKKKLTLEQLDAVIEADPACEKKETKTALMLRNLFFRKELMDREADNQRRVLAEGIVRNPENLEDAALPLSEAVDVLVGKLEDMKNTYLADAKESTPTEEDAYAYAHQFLIYHAIMRFLESVIENDCDYYLHLCDLGCAAVRKRKQEKQKEDKEHGA